MNEIDPTIIAEIKRKIDALSNINRKKVLDLLIEKKTQYASYRISLMTRISRQTAQKSLDYLVECGFVDKIGHLEGARYSVNIDEVVSFQRFLKIFKNRDWD